MLSGICWDREDLNVESIVVVKIITIEDAAGHLFIREKKSEIIGQHILGWSIVCSAIANSGETHCDQMMTRSLCNLISAQTRHTTLRTCTCTLYKALGRLIYWN